MKAKPYAESPSSVAVRRAIEYVGSQQALADAMGVYQSFVSKLARGDGLVPADRCVQIEAITNGVVTRVDLRPDLFGPISVASKKVVAA